MYLFDSSQFYSKKINSNLMYAPKQLSNWKIKSIFELFTRVENIKWCKVESVPCVVTTLIKNNHLKN